MTKHPVRVLVTAVFWKLSYIALEASDSVSGRKDLRSDAQIGLLVTDFDKNSGMTVCKMVDAAREFDRAWRCCS